MPKRETLRKDEEEDDEEMDPVEYLKTLNLEDFLECNQTREIMLCEHYDAFESKLKHKLVNVYNEFNLAFREEGLFGKDWENEQGESFAELIFNYISVKYDISLFYECPSLASALLNKKNK
tara:strand:+ start:599 stop:961 length:363 start_codon:yes stop_codon:yes gene_type:complete